MPRKRGRPKKPKIQYPSQRESPHPLCARCKVLPKEVGAYCRQCRREKCAEWRKRNRDAYNAKKRAYRRKQRKKERERNKKYRDSPKGRAIREAWRNSPRGRRFRLAAQRRYNKTDKAKAKGARWRAKQKAKLTANLPSEVVAPYAERIERDLVARGLDREEMAGVLGFTDIELLHDVAIGKRPQVSLETCDKLAMFGDFNLVELVDRAEEWALLTGDKWPTGYAPRDIGPMLAAR